MTHKEKRREHELEMRWLVNMTVRPIYAYMITIPILVATNAREWYFQMAIEHFAEGVFISFVLFLVFTFLKEVCGYRMADSIRWFHLPKWLRWKFENLWD